MNQKTALQLLALNHKFYQTFAGDFSETRQRLQPGVIQVLEKTGTGEKILDLGCGNGEVARKLMEQSNPPIYTGVDFSQKFLAETPTDLPPGSRCEFIHLDLTTTDWVSQLPCRKYNLVFAFAVLHHLPGDKLRRQVCANIRRHLTGDGVFYHSNWQFLKSPRLRKRIQPWSSIDLNSDQVDEGDYLLDWKRGGYGLRYVHYFTSRELKLLAKDTGFEVVDSFYSDGKEGNLALYQKWKPVNSPAQP
ncbi:MAG: class I SAM-dependent methyltransferase [Anaerolineales bacterium]|nr:class I SAM-dependent methyltransferase [Anaerolineales bacterium]